MGAKYYTHFIAQEADASDFEEYRGVVELQNQSADFRGDRDVAQILARSFDLDEDGIQVLQWQQLH